MLASRIKWAKDGLPKTIVVPAEIAENEEKVREWLEDAWRCPCEDFRLGESVYYTESEKTAIYARVRVLLDRISRKRMVMDSFNKEVCGWVAESIMVNNFDVISPEELDEDWILRELLDFIIKKTM